MSFYYFIAIIVNIFLSILCFICITTQFTSATNQNEVPHLSTLQKSGKRYYYVQRLPIYTDEKGEIITYRSKAFSTKDDAEKHRQEVIIKRDNGLFKLKYLNELAEAKLKPKPVNEAANESYYSFCLRFFQDRDNAAATKEAYIHLINKRFKPFFEDVPIRDLNKGLLQRFAD